MRKLTWCSIGVYIIIIINNPHEARIPGNDVGLNIYPASKTLEVDAK